VAAGKSSTGEPAPAPIDDAEWPSRLLAAREALAGRVHRTPVATSRTLDARLGARVFLKCENLQRAGAFKIRGATYAIGRLDPDVRARGVIAYSSGNHAQAVACAAREAGIAAVIVMPRDAPRVKREATAGYGATIVHPEDLGETREAAAARIARERGLTLVPPFDHPDIIAGQGTAMIELLEEIGPVDLVLVPVGGGGLISGAALATHMMSPGARVIGVEPAAGADGVDSFRTGTLVRRACGETIADGARTPSLGVLTFEVIRRHVAAMMAADDAELIGAMRFVWERMKLVVEPTAVLGLAPLLGGRIDARGRRVAVVLSGGNVDPADAARLLAGG
jgi:threonine dehydratase